MDRRKLFIGLIVALVLSVGVGASVLPSSADGGLATVTLASGKTLTIPASVPCSATPIPPQSEPIVSVTCPPEQPAAESAPDARTPADHDADDHHAGARAEAQAGAEADSEAKP